MFVLGEQVERHRLRKRVRRPQLEFVMYHATAGSVRNARATDDDDNAAALEDF